MTRKKSPLSTTGSFTNLKSDELLRDTIERRRKELRARIASAFEPFSAEQEREAADLVFVLSGYYCLNYSHMYLQRDQHSQAWHAMRERRHFPGSSR